MTIEPRRLHEARAQDRFFETTTPEQVLELGKAAVVAHARTQKDEAPAARFLRNLPPLTR